jgi:hypothetical protein
MADWHCTVELSRTKLRTLPPLVLGGIIENQIRTSSCNKANWSLLHDEVRILIFDRMTENYRRQRPRSGSWEGKLSNERGRAARTRCMNFFSEIYEIPRVTVARGWYASSVLINSTVWAIQSPYKFKNRPGESTNLQGSPPHRSWCSFVHCGPIRLLSVRLSSPGRHPKISGFDVAEGRI